MEDVLVVGQTPPPVNGQTVMIKAFLDGEYSALKLHHVRMTFSRTIDEVGNFQLRKLLILFTTLGDVIRGRFKSRARVLYYPPAGPTLIPVVRDIFLLLSTRWMFRYTVFHFHAAGLTEIYPRLPGILKPFFRLAYGKADLAIFTAKSRSPIGYELGARSVIAVPYGITDTASELNLDRRKSPNETVRILYMGILCEAKGLMTLIEACSHLRDREVPFQVLCGGTYGAGTTREEVEAFLEKYDLKSKFDMPGVLLGDDKKKAFAEADIFCFPSHYYAESSPVVLTEAMSFQLPIVTTNWRGIPDVVGESGGAFVVEPKRPDLVADALQNLILDADLRASMGRNNRAYFVEHGTVEKYRQSLEQSISAVASR